MGALKTGITEVDGRAELVALQGAPATGGAPTPEAAQDPASTGTPSSMSDDPGRTSDDPSGLMAAASWMRDRRSASVCIAALLFMCIFVLRELSTSGQDAFSFLYVIPVAILALEIGLWAGFVAALGATGLVAIWLATRQLPFDATPLAVRAAVVFSVGLIAGWFSDQMRSSSAAVASENARLATLEHDQASLQAEVERMRDQLDKQLRNAATVIERQEQERRGIARQLHEEAAQTMAAALLTVGLLERGTERELTRAQLDDVRSHVRSSIADLQRIASSLRPAVLDEMGLQTALDRIAELEAERNARTVTFSTQGLSASLPPEAEAAAYRVVEEVLAALERADSVSVSLSTPREAIEVVVEAHLGGAPLGESAGEHRNPQPEESLRAALTETCARVELIGGSLKVAPLLDEGSRIVAELPLTELAGSQLR